MLEKRPTFGKVKSAESGTKVRLADGRTVIYPISNPNPVAFAKALMRRRQRQGRDDAPRTTEGIRERMRRQLAARERNSSSVSIQSSDVELTQVALPGGWTLDIQ